MEFFNAVPVNCMKLDCSHSVIQYEDFVDLTAPDKDDSPSTSFIDLDENKENTYDFEETVPDTPIVKTVMSKEGYEDGETPDLMLS